jgi:hypothetical protein
MSSSTFFIEIQHNPPKIINIGQTIDGMEQIDISLDENDIDINAESLKEKIGEMNKTTESQPEPEPEPASETTQEPTQETAPAVPTITGSGKRRKTKRNKKKRINKKKRLTKRSK